MVVTARARRRSRNPTPRNSSRKCAKSIPTKPDQARLTSGWETLLSYDRNYKLGTDALAAEATQDNPKQWTIRLKGGIEDEDAVWDEVWDEALKVNVLAPARLMRHAVRHYLETGGGRFASR